MHADDAGEAWEHIVVGDGDDAGLVFLYRWEPITPELRLWRGVDPILQEL